MHKTRKKRPGGGVLLDKLLTKQIIVKSVKKYTPSRPQNVRFYTVRHKKD
jgi:hypothetical protein